MRVLMMGTGPFAAPTFDALLASSQEVVALCTQPARGKPPTPNLLRAAAQARGLPILDPENVNTTDAQTALAAFQPELLVVADYGQILSNETLAVAPRGGINIHAALLPKYRGAAPIQWAIYNGEPETGVTIIGMTRRLDAGPRLLQARLAIGPEETAEELEPRLAKLGADLCLETIAQMEAGTLVPLPQNAAQATKAPRLKKTDGELDWSRPAEALRNQIRAFQPWPKCHAYWFRPNSAPVRLIVLRARTISDAPRGTPGQVVVSDGKRLVIATGQGGLELLLLQPAGKRPLSVPEFLNGYPVQPGEPFGPTPV